MSTRLGKVRKMSQSRNESEEEFNAICEIAMDLSSENGSVRKKAAETLVNMGKKAVRPLVYVLEMVAPAGADDEEVKAFDKEAEDIIMKIGEDALPDLEDIAADGSHIFYINGFAQDLIFKVMGLEGEDRQKICKHMGKALIEKGGKKVVKCLFCDAEFE